MFKIKSFFGYLIFTLSCMLGIETVHNLNIDNDDGYTAEVIQPVKNNVIDTIDFNVKYQNTFRQNDINYTPYHLINLNEVKPPPKVLNASPVLISNVEVIIKLVSQGIIAITHLVISLRRLRQSKKNKNKEEEDSDTGDENLGI